jgi:hypothetical protein
MAMSREEDEITRMCDNLTRLTTAGAFDAPLDPLKYNAAMGYLVNICELRYNQDPGKYRNLNHLRNGLVHGYSTVNPQDVKQFVTSHLAQLKNNDPLGNISRESVYTYALSYQSASAAFRKKVLDRTQGILSNMSAAQDQVADEGYGEFNKIKTDIEKINGVVGISAQEDVKMAKAFCITCFVETNDQLSVLSKGLDLRSIRDTRNQVAHAKTSTLQDINIDYSVKLILDYNSEAKDIVFSVPVVNPGEAKETAEKAISQVEKTQQLEIEAKKKAQKKKKDDSKQEFDNAMADVYAAFGGGPDSSGALHPLATPPVPPPKGAKAQKREP